MDKDSFHGPLRIAYINTEYMALSHTFIRREVAALRDRGISVTVFSVHGPRTDLPLNGADRLEARTVVNLLPAGSLEVAGSLLQNLLRSPSAWLSCFLLALRHRLPGMKNAVWSMFHFAEAMILARQLRERHIEHIHSHFANPGSSVALLASQYLGIHWSLTLHGLSDFSYPSSPLIPAKIRSSTFTVCISHYAEAQAYLLTSPDLWDRIMLCRSGISSKNLPNRKDRSNKPVRFICVGRLSPEKGHIGLLHAFSGLIRQGVTDVELRIVGDGPERKRITEEAARLGIEAHLSLPGLASEDEVFLELADADIFVLPSFMEGLPVVLIEAMAMRVPCIAPNIAGIPEIIKHERTGLLFTVSRWDELQLQMLRLKRHPELRTRLAERAAHLFTDELEIDKTIQPFIDRLFSIYGDSLFTHMVPCEELQVLPRAP